MANCLFITHIESYCDVIQKTKAEIRRGGEGNAFVWKEKKRGSWEAR